MRIIIFSFWFLIPLICLSQDSNKAFNRLPNVYIKTRDGKYINASGLNNNGKPIIICFWKVCCKSPVELLNAISEIYKDWVDETSVKLYAVSVDDSRNTNKVDPFASGNGWEFEILLDPNSDLKRTMNVIDLPHTFVLNGKGEIIWDKSTYLSGDEVLIFEKIKETVN